MQTSLTPNEKHPMILSFLVDGEYDGVFEAECLDKNVDAVEDILIEEGYKLFGVDGKANDRSVVIVYKD